MKVLTIAGFILAGRDVGKGEVLEVPDHLVAQLTYANRVVPYDDPTPMVTREGAPPPAGPPVATTRGKGRVRHGSGD